MNGNQDKGSASGGQPATIVIQQAPSGFARFRSWLLYAILMSSLFANLSMYLAFSEYFAGAQGPDEKLHSGDWTAPAKLAIIRVSGTIMPPFTDRILKSIKKAKDDDAVKGILLAVDSPGGLVTDSHQIYHKLKELSAKKPVVVSMGGMAASGGYYVSMGAGEKGKIFAEPTTWTGSIGVIIPHYEFSDLAEKVGFKSIPLKTGEFKDALSPFREITAREKALWDDILNQSFDQFLGVIDENRANLDLKKIKELATGQIYTAQDAKKNGLIDEIGYEEDALEELKKLAGVTDPRVVTYQHPVTLVDALLGSAQTPDPVSQWRTLMEATVPRAMYYCSWLPALPGQRQ